MHLLFPFRHFGCLPATMDDWDGPIVESFLSFSHFFCLAANMGDWDWQIQMQRKNYNQILHDSVTVTFRRDLEVYCRKM